MKRKKVYLNNHQIIGAAILDLARAYFYKVWYAIKRQFMERVSCIYTDTDSLLLKLQTDNLYESLNAIRVDGEEIMDFSYLPNEEKYRKYRSDKFKGVVGKLKSETHEKEILEVVVLKKKQYALLVNDPEHGEKLRAKGIPLNFL
jgi:rRNA-processing protein FCF1